MTYLKVLAWVFGGKCLVSFCAPKNKIDVFWWVWFFLVMFDLKHIPTDFQTLQTIYVFNGIIDGQHATRKKYITIEWSRGSPLSALFWWFQWRLVVAVASIFRLLYCWMLESMLVLSLPFNNWRSCAQAPKQPFLANPVMNFGYCRG